MDIRKNLLEKGGAKEFSKELELVGKLDAKSLMNALPLRLLGDDSLEDLIDAFSANNIDVVIVGDERDIEGVVSKKDLLDKLNSPKLADLEKKKIKEVLTKKFINVSEDSLLQSLCNTMITEKPECLVVGSKSNCMGIVGYIELLAGFRKFCLKIDNPPSIGSIMKKHEVHMADYLMTLDLLIKSMKRQAVDYAIVMKENAPIGIISSKDVVTALKKDLSWDKMNANTIMSPHIVSLTSGHSVNDALVIMLDRKFNQIPIIDNKELVGVITLPILLNAYYDFIDELKTLIKDKDVTDIISIVWKE